MSQYAQPSAPSEGINWNDLKGSLLLISVKGVETAIPTQFGESDAVRANIAVLDGTQAGERYDDTLIFPKILRSQTGSQVGKMVLGRLTQGVAKPKQSPPWMLEPATDDDAAKADAYLASANAPVSAAPPQAQAQPQQQPPAQQWAQGQQPQPAASAQNVPF